MKLRLNVVTILLIVLIIFAFSGGLIGWYPHTYGMGGGGLLLLVLILLLIFGRL
jgi:hypothetical protein